MSAYIIALLISLFGSSDSVKDNPQDCIDYCLEKVDDYPVDSPEYQDQLRKCKKECEGSSSF